MGNKGKETLEEETVKNEEMVEGEKGEEENEDSSGETTKEDSEDGGDSPGEKDSWLEDEVNRRVNQALEMEREKQEEKERLARLSEEERVKEIERIKQEELDKRERELNIKTVELEIMTTLRDSKLLDAKNLFKAENYIDNKGLLKADIEALKTFLEDRVKEETTKLRKEILQSGEYEPEKERERITEYQAAKKNGSIFDMLSSKLNK